MLAPVGRCVRGSPTPYPKVRQSQHAVRPGAPSWFCDPRPSGAFRGRCTLEEGERPEMPRGGLSRGPKRKRSRDAEYPSFPGESPLPCRRAGLRTVGAEASLSEAWLRCGEGFLKSPGTPPLTAEKKTTTEKHLELSCPPKKEPTAFKSTSGLAAITWSSSGSDLSDEDKTAFKSYRDNRYSRTGRCPEDGASEDDLQVIDWEIDSEREDACERDEFEDRESVLEISDCASGASSRSLTPAETPPELPKVRTNCFPLSVPFVECVSHKLWCFVCSSSK
uniref:DUF4502 domain-containing protein n=2 Tax=Capra hircus TaxID=9925 RepID=A0A8C2NY33_CAPHI